MPGRLRIGIAAAILKVSRRTIYNMIRDGRLQCERPFLNRGWWVTTESVDMQLESQRIKSRAPLPPRCSDCGAEMNEGEAKVFTCCDACWDKHYRKSPVHAETPQDSRMWRLLKNIQGWGNSVEFTCHERANGRGTQDDAWLGEVGARIVAAADELLALHRTALEAPQGDLMAMCLRAELEKAQKERS